MISRDDARQAKGVLAARYGGLGGASAARASLGHRARGVVGFAIGQEPDGSHLARLFVQRKLPTACLSGAGELAPRAIDGVRVDVVAVGDVRPRVLRMPEAAGVYTARERPARCGASVGHPAITAGTIGAVCVLGDRRLAILSNNHVLAAVNGGTVGDVILQPGTVDGGREPGDKAGHLIRFVPLAWNGGGNTVDAAVAWTQFAEVEPAHHAFTIDPEPQAPALALAVQKEGRTSGFTSGTIADLEADLVVNYAPEAGLASFTGQVRIVGPGPAPFSQPGDSGSLIVAAATRRPVALLFSGGSDPSGTVSTFACPIAGVMAALDITRFLGPTET